MANNLVLDGRLVKSEAYVGAGATLTVSAEKHAGKVIGLDTAAASTVTLPQATGSGNRYKFVVTTLATASSHVVKVGNSTDVMEGIAFGYRTDSGNATLGFGTSATSDTVTLNRTTTGSVQLGEWIEIYDQASGVFTVFVIGCATGAAYATPFSAMV